MPAPIPEPMSRHRADVVAALTAAHPAASVRPGHVTDRMAHVIVMPRAGDAVHVTIDRPSAAPMLGVEVSRGGLTRFAGGLPGDVVAVAVAAVADVVAA